MLPLKIVAFGHELLEDSLAPIYIKDINGIYVYCNKSFVQFIGLPRAKILGHTPYGIAPVRLAEVYVNADKTLFESTNSQQYSSSVQTSGKIETAVTFNKTALFDMNGKVTGLIGAISLDPITTPDHRLKAKFTTREYEILLLLMRGKSSKVMSHLLGISNHTTNGYMKSIYMKLDVHSKNEAIYKAITLFNGMELI